MIIHKKITLSHKIGPNFYMHKAYVNEMQDINIYSGRGDQLMPDSGSSEPFIIEIDDTLSNLDMAATTIKALIVKYEGIGLFIGKVENINIQPRIEMEFF